MVKEQKGFIVYGDIKATADELSDDQLGKLFRGMIGYFVDGNDPGFKDELKFAFIPIKQQMDRDANKYDAKCERMRENAQKRWRDNAIASKSNQLDANDANTNTNKDTKTNKDKDKNTNTNTMSVETDAPSLPTFLIGYLNDKTGSNYKVTKAVLAQLEAIFAAGYTSEQIRSVIDKKCAEWLGDEKMRGYLRPSTLFGEKFVEYLAAPVSIAQEKERETNRKKSRLNKELEEKRIRLDGLRDALKGADKTERRALREQIAMLEDSIGVIERRLA